jgi:hypothetical protein
MTTESTRHLARTLLAPEGRPNVVTGEAAQPRNPWKAITPIPSPRRGEGNSTITFHDADFQHPSPPGLILTPQRGDRNATWHVVGPPVTIAHARQPTTSPLAMSPRPRGRTPVHVLLTLPHRKRNKIRLIHDGPPPRPHREPIADIPQPPPPPAPRRIPVASEIQRRPRTKTPDLQPSFRSGSHRL